VKLSIITSLYRGEKYLDSFLREFLSFKILQDLELILVHNDPTDAEEDVIKRFSSQIPNLVHIRTPREGIYASWNRAISHSKGDYICMWNIDDVWREEGIKEQIRKLDEDPGNIIVSGDYYKVFKYGHKNGLLKKDPVVPASKRPRYKFNNGCFLMWRKTVHEELGYFDEQFMVAGDLEFWHRVTSRYAPVRTEAILGYYLREENVGLSKRHNKQKYIESFIVKARYYTVFLANIYSYYLQSAEKKISYRVIRNYGKSVELLAAPKINYLSVFLSLFLFWVPNILSGVIVIKYKLASAMHRTKTK
jgi:glycosyltransferase involved in cell wall biosynthesis